MLTSSHVPPGDPLRIVVADDHDSVRDSVVRLLASQPNMCVIAEVANHTELGDVLSQFKVDVIVLDLTMPGRSPIAVVSGIRYTNPTVKIIVYSAALDAVAEMLRLGVHGYVVKTDSYRAIVEAIMATMHGHTYLSPTVDSFVHRHELNRKQHGLTSQHVEVLRLMNDGFETREIANELGITVKVVQNYVLAIRRRTGLHERPALTAHYRRLFLDSPSG